MRRLCLVPSTFTFFFLQDLVSLLSKKHSDFEFDTATNLLSFLKNKDWIIISDSNNFRIHKRLKQVVLRNLKQIKSAEKENALLDVTNYFVQALKESKTNFFNADKGGNRWEENIENFLFDQQKTNILGVLKGQLKQRVAGIENAETARNICREVIQCWEFLQRVIEPKDQKQVLAACIDRYTRGGNDENDDGTKKKLENLAVNVTCASSGDDTTE